MHEFLTAVFWTSWLSSFTIEFAVLFSKMSHGVLGVLRTDLALDKVGSLVPNDGNCDDTHRSKFRHISVGKAVGITK